MPKDLDQSKGIDRVKLRFSFVHTVFLPLFCIFLLVCRLLPNYFDPMVMNCGRDIV